MKEMSRAEANKNENGQRLDLQGWHTFIIMVGGASLCFLISIIIIFYYVYLRFYSNPRREQRIRSRSAGNEQDYFFTQAREGLCKQALDALPVFVYRPGNFKDGLRCAVCLCEFQGEEAGRLLPVCDHRFHLECIDMWFSSHSTCPICRASVEKESDENLQSPVLSAELGSRVTAEVEEEESSAPDPHPQKGNLEQGGSNIVREMGISIHGNLNNEK